MANLSRPPIFNAPPVLTACGLLLVGLHAAWQLAPDGVKEATLVAGAVFPERFWAWLGGEPVSPQGVPAYGSLPAAITPLLASGLLHGDWMHAILNALLLIAMGKPVYQLMEALAGPRWAGPLFFGVFALSQAAGGIALLLVPGEARLAIGASAGVSGILAVLLLFRLGPEARILSRGFLGAAFVFALANAVLAFVGPSLLGSHVAWQGHIGGFLAGALLARLLLSIGLGQAAG